ncbi:MAG: hypothetical protein V3U57_06070 [Robiginitomaculum sp.]
MNFSSPLSILLHLAAFSFFISLAVSGFMISAGFIDNPVSRSAHKEATPTGGGVGIVAGSGAGLLALSMFYPYFGNQSQLGLLAALVFLGASLGLIDDIIIVNAKLKFAIITGLSCAAVLIIGAPLSLPTAHTSIPLPAWFGFCGGVLWVFCIVNCVNFMDGANGQMGKFMSIAFIGMGLVSLMSSAITSALLAFIMAGALLGFLPYNLKTKALIFSGDVGSLTVGFVYSICALLLAAHKPDFLYVGPLLVLPFITDVILTLFVRSCAKKNLFEAHKDHIYQRLIRAGSSHIEVTMTYSISAILMCVITIAGVHYGLINSIFFFGVWVCVLSIIYAVLHKWLANAVDDESG